MKKLKLGVVPIKRNFLPMDAAKAQKDAFMPVIRSIKSDYVEIIDVDELTENGIAFTYEVVAPIVKKLKENSIDALFLGDCLSPLYGLGDALRGLGGSDSIPTDRRLADLVPFAFEPCRELLVGVGGVG